MKRQPGWFVRHQRLFGILPLVLLLLVLAFGLLHIDFGDESTAAYGWLYLFFVMPGYILLTLASVIFNGIMLASHWRPLTWQWGLGVGGLLGWALVTIHSPLAALMPAMVMNQPWFWLDLVMLSCLAISRWQAVTTPQRAHAWLVGTLVPLGVAAVFVGGAIGQKIATAHADRTTYTQALTAALKKAGIPGKLGWPTGLTPNYDGTAYTVTDRGLTVYGLATFKKVAGKWQLKKLGLTTDRASIRTYATGQALLPANRQLLTRFRASFQAAAKKAGLAHVLRPTSTLSVKEYGPFSNYDAPQYYWVNSHYDATPLLDRVAANRHSSGRNGAFNGFGSLTVPTLLAAHRIVALLPLTASAKTSVRAHFATKKATLAFAKTMDWTKLPNGDYELDIGQDVSFTPVIHVVDHRAVKIIPVDSLEMLAKPGAD